MKIDLTECTVASTLRNQAQRFRDRRFLQIVDGPSKTYGEMQRLAESWALDLHQMGVRRGDAVAVMLPNGVEAVVCWLSLSLLGAVDVYLNTAYRGVTLEHALNLCKAHTMVASPEYLGVIKEIEGRLTSLGQVVVVGDADAPVLTHVQEIPYRGELEPSSYPERMDALSAVPTGADIASIIYTSGTTGPAKAVLMPQAENYLLGKMTKDHLRMDEADVFYCFHPMFHMAGRFMAVYGTLLAGGVLVLDGSFRPDSWVEDISRYGATVGLAHGPMIEMIHAQAPSERDRTHSMTRILAAPLPKGIAEDFESRFGIRGIEVWGMTETGVPVWRPYDDDLRIGSCGVVDDEWYDVRVVDPETDRELPTGTPGEIIVRGKAPWIMMQGYKGMPEKTVESWRNLWFHSGDVAYFDREGYLYFVDRLKDRIRRRAENISSYDIESAALLCERVGEAAAVGVASAFEGDDDIKLVIAPTQAGQAIEPERLLRHMVRHLPHYMVPRYIEVVEALPRTPTNKVKKSSLREAGVGPTVWDRKGLGISLKEVIEQERRSCS